MRIVRTAAVLVSLLVSTSALAAPSEFKGGWGLEMQFATIPVPFLGQMTCDDSGVCTGSIFNTSVTASISCTYTAQPSGVGVLVCVVGSVETLQLKGVLVERGARFLFQGNSLEGTVNGTATRQ